MWEKLYTFLVKIIPKRVAVWGAVFAAIAFVALVAYAVYDNRTVTLWPPTIHAKEDGAKSPNYEMKHMIGYYYTLDENANTTCVSEDIEMKWFTDGKTVTGATTGQVHNSDGEMVTRRWIHEGVRHGNDISLYYITDTANPTGAGVYYLMSKGGAYAGYWLGVDFPTDKRVQCPYILVGRDEKLLPEESCETKWPDVFNSKSHCKILRD